MTKDVKKIWESCLALIKQEVDERSFRIWFAPIIPCKYENNVLTLGIPDPFFYQWLEGHYVNLLRKVIHKELGEEGRLAYQVITPQKKQTKNSITPPQQTKKQFATETLNPHFTFDNFVVGDCNQLAHAATENVSKNPGRTSFNPLMIFSEEPGLGKSHLVQATMHHIQKLHPQKKGIYITAEKFTAQFIQKIRENKLEEFINFYSNLDILIIDDIQFLAKKEKTQEMFFHIFNHLHQYDKQLIMTSDCAPSHLEGFQKRLLSRFKWGLTVDLQKPDLETRIAIVQKKLQRNNLEIDESLVHYIAENITTNIRELEGVLISTIAYADLNKKNLNKTLVKQIITNVVGKAKSTIEINLKYLQKMVANYHNIAIEKLKTKSRKKEIVILRQLTMYLARKYTNQSLKNIGEIFGHKDHSTVSHALKVIQNTLKTDKQFKRKVEEIEQKINKDST